MMNPASNSTERADYTNIRDKIQSIGHEVNYYVDNGTVADRWCLSVPYAELDSIYIIEGDEATPWCVFKNGNQYE